jgi:acetylornithine deacetylase/succinyl-diaminopimelate desuccinylase-like protein
VVTLNTEQISSRLRERLSEPVLLDLTKRLILIPSENPPGNHYKECARTLCDELDRLGFDNVRREGACVLGSAGTGPRTLYFSGHYDVVPAQSRDQFQPRVEGANLFGRGSSDMKSGLAAMIHAAAAARDEGLLKTGRIGIVLVPDEETAGPRGSRDLDARGLLGRVGVGMLTPEPTGGVIWNANRGAISLRATMRGKAAHVGRQFEGVNAFERAVPAMARLLDIKKEAELRETQCNIAPAAARKSILMLGGRAEAGTNFNVTPDFCSFTIDRRINPEENLEDRESPIARYARRFRDRDASGGARNGDFGARCARRDSITSHRERDQQGTSVRNVPRPSRNAILRGLRCSRVRLWTGIADRVSRTERVRSNPQHFPMRVDLRAYGGGDVALIDSWLLAEGVADPITVG